MANRFYLDASALVKRYVDEVGTAVLNHLFQSVPRTNMVCLVLTTLEVISILVRKQNAGRLSPAEFNQCLVNFRTEVIDAIDFSKVSVTDPMVGAATPFLLKHSLNATDSIVLRSAVDMAAQARPAGDDLVLVASDQRLLKAAQAEGLTTLDPETQDTTALDALLQP